jgi:hypothetical protein
VLGRYLALLVQVNGQDVPVGPIAKMAVLRRGLAGARPFMNRYQPPLEIAGITASKNGVQVDPDWQA